MGRPTFSPGKKLTGGKFRPVTPVSDNGDSNHMGVWLDTVTVLLNNIEF